MDDKALTFEQKAVKRANNALATTIAIVSALLMVMHVGQYFQGEKLMDCIIIIALIAVPMVVSIVLYKINPLSERYHAIAFGVFLIAFEAACLSSTIFLYNLFIYPVLITMIMYFDKKMEIRASAVVLLCCFFNAAFTYHVRGTADMIEANRMFMICLLGGILGVGICFAAKVAALRNEEEIAVMQANHDKQEDMMRSIVAVGTSLNKSTESIHSLVEALQDATNSVNIAMTDVAVSMESTASSVQEQAEVTGHIQDIIDETVAEADNLENISRSTRANVKTGQALVAQIVTQTEQIEQENTMVKDNMSQLHTHTKDMQKIIGIIQQISAQTNLLALNASIEAARAGEAGRGFAVVAEEIRVLSEQTKQSTEHIEEIISKLDKNAADTISSMDKVMDKIGEQVTMIKDIEENFSQIRSGMSDLKQNSINMSENVKKLKESNESLVDSTNSLSATSEEVSASAEETNAMCSDNVERFKVIQNVLSGLREDTSKMDGFIEEYHRLHETEPVEPLAVAVEA